MSVRPTGTLIALLRERGGQRTHQLVSPSRCLTFSTAPPHTSLSYFAIGKEEQRAWAELAKEKWGGPRQ
jgi:hypothetical protein